MGLGGAVRVLEFGRAGQLHPLPVSGKDGPRNPLASHLGELGSVIDGELPRRAEAPDRKSVV